MKIVYEKLAKITIDEPEFVEIITDIVVRYHGLSNLIITNKSSFVTSKFWSLRCYFFDIKQKLCTTFYPQTNNQTKQQNSIIKAYIQIFVNFK